MSGDAHDVPSVLSLGILAVVDLALNEPPTKLPRELAHCRFPLIDGSGNPRWLLRAAVETVTSLLRSGTPTLVYCGAGMSRTPAIAGAAIALVIGCTPQEGLTIALQSRPSDVSPALWAEVMSSIA